MELSQLSKKEIINLYDGSRLGYVADSDLVIDEATGDIQSIIIVPRGAKLRGVRELSIPWAAIKKIGEEVLIVELSPERNVSRKSF
ncbi:MAG: YlmC/YmxH family sporulation protein [Dethiobacter sp.]|jgi:YlmC/YmxH family sporulation protein|nr:YlmC/YmxH family sporulation protein [Dethiobacter sp.]MBS3897483.1 YlmC/YmxH family sporulation protein [Dethiobacter sp.]MBS3983605.1 YlmC/YmxH family sporulation protein [Dethiobacter sp.]MCL4462848.1 YlmC/YmxH family sporulation protein [Bacillota bacterium]MCL5993605.1 YlmC/YmxH family sporulation protein [Bacillota bacterium]